MKIKSLENLFRAAFLCLACAWGTPLTRAQEDLGNIVGYAGFRPLVKIAITGFSGEVARTLLFDLEVAGCTNTTPDLAQYLVSGTNNERVEGHLTDRISKAVLLSKAYAGGSLRQQTHALADDIIKAITGANGIARTKIAFKLNRGGSSEIVVADYDGANPVSITRDGSIVAAPAWAPGNRLLFYTAYLMNNPDLYSHDLQTGDRKLIAGYSGLNTGGVVSPEGRRLAFVLSKSGSPDIWVSDLNGGNLRQLTKTKEDESAPCWSPDGQNICFVSRQPGRPSLYTIPAAGGAMKRLPTPGVVNATEPDWSPDGKWIAFTAQMGGFQICVLQVGSGRVQVLTSGEDPSWAPNSRTLIFTRRLGGARVLSLLDVPTKRVKDIARISGSASQPCWSK